MKTFEPLKIEKKWQKKWEESKINEKDMDKVENPFYNLMMFPYPSAEGLHIGSVYTFSGVDTFGRFNQMQDKSVFEPIGLDGFGIHSENFAIKIGEHIRDVSKRTEKHFYDQMKATGNMYDWSRTVETYKPDYYKWTQWLFTTLYKAGLAYRKKSKVNWCPGCKTVLSDEQVIDGLCERSGDEVTKRDMKQWFFKITDYADRLNQNLEWIKWDNDVKVGQKNWIGRSMGAQVKFEVRSQGSGARGQESGVRSLPTGQAGQENKKDYLEVYTTAHDTIFGATFMVIAPEHSLIEEYRDSIKNIKEVEEYIKESVKKSDLERTDLNKDKKGVKINGVTAINPVNGKEIPIFVADYVLVSYGTGSIMAVPGHDERDYEFAVKYGLDIIYVVKDNDEFISYQDIKQNPKKFFLKNSGKYDGMDFKKGRSEMLKDFAASGFAKAKVNFRLRDWTVSRQRYWGPPIPMINIGNSKSENQSYKLETLEKDSNWAIGNIQRPEIGNQKTKVLVLHGTSGNSQKNWFQWLKTELSKNDIEVAVPDLPDTDNPNYDERMDYLAKNYSEFLDENTVVIGHSLGASTALHLAEKYKLKDLILVAPYVYSRDDRFDKFAEAFSKGTASSVVEYHKKGYDFGKINNNVDLVTVLAGAKDKWITSDYIDYLKENIPNIRVKIYDKLSHLSDSSDGMTSFPDILNYINEEKWMVVSEEDLPVLLPDIERFEDILPDGSGKGPLEKQEDFVDASEKYGEGAKRETDVSDPFVDSCWYFLRYPFTELQDKPFEFVKRPQLGEETEQKEGLVETFTEVYNLIDAAGLYPMVNGSLLVTALNGKTFKKIRNIDIAFSEKKQLSSAVAILKENGFSQMGEGDFKNIFLERNGIEVELSYGWGDVYMGYKVKLFDQKVRIFDPKVLREYYVKNHEQHSVKVDIIDDWANQRINKWFPVTYYIGGKEHTVLHLLYARFITMVLNDLGYIDFEEPFLNFYGHGLITKDGAKMSKSKGNVINPDEYYEKYGADPVRMYLRFLGPFDQGGDWRDTGMNGMKKFVNKIWEIYQKFVLQDIDYSDNPGKINKLHQTVKAVAEDLSGLRFNTAIAKIMELINWYKENEGHFDKKQIEEILEKLALMLAPIVPHFAEELWELLNTSKTPDWKWSNENSVHSQKWPEYDEAKILEDVVVIAIQINGKMRGTVETVRGVTEEEVMNLIKDTDVYERYNVLTSKKIIFIKDKIINIIV